VYTRVSHEGKGKYDVIKGRYKLHQGNDGLMKVKWGKHEIKQEVTQTHTQTQQADSCLVAQLTCVPALMLPQGW
jgi:hypothetical protein